MQWFKRLIFLGSATLIACGLAEISLRYFWPFEPQYIVTYQITPAINAPGTSIPQVLAAIEGNQLPRGQQTYERTTRGTRFIPNQLTILNPDFNGTRNLIIRVNSLGTRGEEPSSKPSHAPLLLLGDSITVQDYLFEESTTAVQLQRSLNDSFPGLQVINAGITGSNLAMEILRAEELLPRVRPQLVVVLFFLNDLAESHSFFALKLPRLLERSYAARIISWDLQQEIEKYRAGPSELEGFIAEAKQEIERETPGALSKYIPGYPYRFEDFRDNLPPFAPSAWTIIEQQMKELHALVQKHGASLVIAFTPGTYQLGGPRASHTPQRRMAEVAARLNVPYIDIAQAFENVPDGDFQALFFDHCHPTAQGSTRVAALLQKRLSSLIR